MTSMPKQDISSESVIKKVLTTVPIASIAVWSLYWFTTKISFQLPNVIKNAWYTQSWRNQRHCLPFRRIWIFRSFTILSFQFSDLCPTSAATGQKCIGNKANARQCAHIYTSVFSWPTIAFVSIEQGNRMVFYLNKTWLELLSFAGEHPFRLWVLWFKAILCHLSYNFSRPWLVEQ